MQQRCFEGGLLMRIGHARLRVCSVLLAVALIPQLGAALSPQGGSLALCGNPGTAPPVQHVIVVMLENLSYNQVVGSTNAPFQTSLASSCAVAPDYFGATHTSAANYLAVSAGEYPADSPPGCGDVPACADSSNNLYNQLSGAGLSWGGFMESMPSACDPKSSGGNTSSHDLYSVGHDPIVFYTDISASQCQADDLGVPSLTAASGAFYNDLQNQTLPSFSMVIPNTANDNEGPGTKAQNEQVADTWLKNFVGLVQSSPSYQAGNTLLLIGYDEGSAGDADYAVGENCTNEALDLPVTNGVSAHQDSCHVPLFVIYPYTPAGDADTTFFDHYSITKTVEDAFGLPYLAHAGDAQTNSLAGHFGIPAPLPRPTPVVTISQPTSGSTVSGTLTVGGTVADSASVTQVQVSVDGGTPVTATGTTTWSTSLNTSSLSNGTHTITATATDAYGDTGSASVPVTVENATTSCPATPSGATELSGNVSVETNQNGWTGVYNADSSVTRIEPAGGSYDGSWALQIAPKKGDSGAAGVNNANPVWVPGPPGTTTTAGEAFTGSVFVSANTPGEQVTLLIRETTTSGTAVGSHTTTVTLSDTNWHQITSAYTAKNSGDMIRYFLYGSNFASSGQNFLADCLSLQTP